MEPPDDLEALALGVLDGRVAERQEAADVELLALGVLHGDVEDLGRRRGAYAFQRAACGRAGVRVRVRFAGIYIYIYMYVCMYVCMIIAFVYIAFD